MDQGVVPDKNLISKQIHHEQQDLCSTRPCYRQGRKLTAVKVYTVSDESTHLIVNNVPAIKLQAQLCDLCNRFGDVNVCILVPDYDSQQAFVETFHVQYSRIQSARFAKKQLDGRSFYGGVLHVCYAPELEDVNETRAKLVQRRKEIATRIKRKLQSNNVTHESKGQVHTSRNKIITERSTQRIEIQNQLQKTCDENIIGNVSSHLSRVNQELKQVPKEAIPMQFSQSSVDTNFNTSHSTKTEISVPSSSQNLYKFIPRSVAISKRIVFHKK